MTVITPKQIVDNISSSVSNTVIDAIQTAQDQYITSQNIEIKCDDDVNNYLIDQLGRCLNSFSTSNHSKEDIQKICTIPVYCNASNINIKSSVNINNLTNQTTVIQSNINNSISNNISQNLSSLDPSILSLISGSNKDITQNISNITKVVTDNTTKILQSVYNNISQSQTLTLSNYEADNVNFNIVSNVVINILQSNNDYQSAVTDISNQLSQVANSSNQGLSSIITKIYIIALAAIVILFLLLFFLKRKNTRDFITFIFPYFIFIVVASSIFLINLYVEPSWVLDSDNTTVKKLNSGKYILYSFLPIILFGFIEYAVYKFYINKKTN